MVGRAPGITVSRVSTAQGVPFSAIDERPSATSQDFTLGPCSNHFLELELVSSEAMATAKFSLDKTAACLKSWC